MQRGSKRPPSEVSESTRSRRPKKTPSNGPTDVSPPKVTRIDFTTVDPQSSCPLFSLPGELRNLIWEYALTPYNDDTRPYPTATAYYRPDYHAPRTSAVALLRTCKAVYSEAWYLPRTTAELVFYLTSETRRPLRVETVDGVQHILQHLQAKGVDTSIQHVRVFAQLYKLEGGKELQQILGMHHFNPREITVTIRHTDFWYWEKDLPLHVGGDWVDFCQFPMTVKRIRVEFESLERKKSQVDEIAQQAVEKWRFRRVDGSWFSAVTGQSEDGKVEGEMEVMRWTGGSSWEGIRWVRDEMEHNKLNYYVKSVIWRIDRVFEGQRQKEKSHPSLSLPNPPRINPNPNSNRLLAKFTARFISIIETTTEEELDFVGRHEDGTVENLRQEIYKWRHANGRLPWRVPNGRATRS